MKKIISVILAFAMLFSGCLAFSSCRGLSKKSAEKEPSETIYKAFEETLSSFFDDGTGVYEIYKKAKENSAKKFYLKGSLLLGEELSVIEGTFFSDIKKNYYILDASATYNGIPMSERICFDKDGAVGVPKLGDKYTFDYNTFITVFEESGIIEYLEINGSGAKFVTDLFYGIKEGFANSPKKYKEALYGILNTALGKLNQNITEEQMEIGGTKTDCIVYSYQITNETVRAALYEIYNGLLKENDIYSDIKNNLDTLINEVNLSLAYDCTAKIAVNKETGKIVNLGFDANAKRTDEAQKKESITLKITLDFGETEIGVSIYRKDEKYEDMYYISLVKAKENGNVIYTASYNNTYKILGKANQQRTESRKAELRFSADGKLNLYIMKDDKNDLRLEGAYSVSKTKADFKISAVEERKDGVSSKKAVEIGLEIDTEAKIPDAPSVNGEIKEIDSEKMENAFGEIKNSNFYKIFSRLVY